MNIIFRKEFFSVKYIEKFNMDLLGIPCRSGPAEGNELYDFPVEERDALDAAITNFLELASKTQIARANDSIKVPVSSSRRFFEFNLVSQAGEHEFSNFILLPEKEITFGQDDLTKEYYVGKYQQTVDGYFFYFYPLENKTANEINEKFDRLRAIVEKARKREYDEFLLVQPFIQRGGPS